MCYLCIRVCVCVWYLCTGMMCISVCYLCTGVRCISLYVTCVQVWGVSLCMLPVYRCEVYLCVCYLCTGVRGISACDTCVSCISVCVTCVQVWGVYLHVIPVWVVSLCVLPVYMGVYLRVIPVWVVSLCVLPVYRCEGYICVWYLCELYLCVCYLCTWGYITTQDNWVPALWYTPQVWGGSLTGACKSAEALHQSAGSQTERAGFPADRDALQWGVHLGHLRPPTGGTRGERERTDQIRQYPPPTHWPVLIHMPISEWL